MNKAIVKLNGSGYCIVIIRQNSMLRASSIMSANECHGAIQGTTIGFLDRQAEMYRHFITTKDIDRKAPRQRVYPS